MIAIGWLGIALILWGVSSAFVGDGQTSSGRLAISALLVTTGVLIVRWAQRKLLEKERDKDRRK